jgi:hypothetical protein
MEDKTPEDVAFEKMLKRSGKAYDKAMPEPDTTYGEIKNLPYKPGMDKGLEPKNLPYKPGSEKGMEVKPLGRSRASKDTSYAKGGKVSSASKRADGIAQRGKTKGTIIMCGGGYAKGK